MAHPEVIDSTIRMLFVTWLTTWLCIFFPRFRRAVFALYVCCNMMAAALLFFPWIKPRETISGFLGRWSSTRSVYWHGRLANIGAAAVDFIYFWEPDHCNVTWLQEARAREALCYHSPER